MRDKPRPRRKEATNGNGGTSPMNATPTLYEWAGGEAAIRRLMDCFYDRVERDELLSPYFPGGVSEEHRAHVSTWWSEVLGGPASYTKDLGGYEKMLAHHRGLGIAPGGAASLRLAAQLRGRRRRPSGRPRVPLGARRLRRVGIPPCDAQLPAGRRGLRSTRLSLAGAGARRPPSSPRKLMSHRDDSGEEATGLSLVALSSRPTR